MQKFAAYIVPIFIVLLLVFDLSFTGVNPYEIKASLGWIQDPNQASGNHCSFGLKQK